MNVNKVRTTYELFNSTIDSSYLQVIKYVDVSCIKELTIHNVSKELMNLDRFNNLETLIINFDNNLREDFIISHRTLKNVVLHFDRYVSNLTLNYIKIQSEIESLTIEIDDKHIRNPLYINMFSFPNKLKTLKLYNVSMNDHSYQDMIKCIRDSCKFLTHLIIKFFNNTKINMNVKFNKGFENLTNLELINSLHTNVRELETLSTLKVVSDGIVDVRLLPSITNIHICSNTLILESIPSLNTLILEGISILDTYDSIDVKNIIFRDIEHLEKLNHQHLTSIESVILECCNYNLFRMNLLLLLDNLKSLSLITCTNDTNECIIDKYDNLEQLEIISSTYDNGFDVVIRDSVKLKSINISNYDNEICKKIKSVKFDNITNLNMKLFS